MAHPCNPSSHENDRGMYRQYESAEKNSFTSYTSEPRQQKSFWTTLARKAKSAILDDGLSSSNARDSELMKDRSYESSQQTRSFVDNKQRPSEIMVIQKKLESITSSLSSFGDAIGNVLEEGLNIVETKATDFLTSDSRKLFTKKSFDSVTRSTQSQDPLKGISHQYQTAKNSSFEENNASLSQQQETMSSLYPLQSSNSLDRTLKDRETGSKSLHGRDFGSDTLQKWKKLGNTGSQQDNNHFKQDTGMQDLSAAAGDGSRSLQGRDFVSDSLQRWQKLGNTVSQVDNRISKPFQQDSGIQDCSAAAGDGSRASQGRDFVSDSLERRQKLGKTMPQGNNNISMSFQQDSGVQDYSAAPGDKQVNSFRDGRHLENKQTVSKSLQGRVIGSESSIVQKESDAKLLQQSDNISKPVQKHGLVQDISASDKDVQLKASRDVAMAMATKAKLLSRELKEAKAELAIAKEKCTQLEEENRMIRESLSNGLKLDEEDLVRIQLETLLAEKAHLAQENAYYARENQFLRDMLEYHRATMHVCGLTPEQISDVSDFASELNEENDLPPEIIISTVSN